MNRYNKITAQEAATLIKHKYIVGIGGFSSVGTPKAVPTALAQYAQAQHEQGIEFQIGLITGGATGNAIDGALSQADAVLFRTPFQSNKDMRSAINEKKIAYFDLHLSHIAQDIKYKFLPKIDIAIIEASEITDDGEITLTTSVGISPTLLMQAEKIIIELNKAHDKKLKGMHDIYIPINPPYRKEIPIYHVNDHIGNASIKINPQKIIAIVETNERDNILPFTPINKTTQQIGYNVAQFLLKEWEKGNIPKEFLPIQSGVGNIANAVLGTLGEDKRLPAFCMFTEVIQNSVIDLMEKGTIQFATGSSLTLSEEHLDTIYNNLHFFKNRILLRPQEITNHPEVIRRLGVIAINTALEADLFGNINSTHTFGSKIINGIGGSADFSRNAYISIFTTPSTAKNGLISSIVPHVSHVDSTEHDVRVLITEQGIADLRGKSPFQKAQCIIENCAHPDYKQILWDYLNLSKNQSFHIPFNLKNAFQMHLAFEETGNMKNTKFIM